MSWVYFHFTFMFSSMLDVEERDFVDSGFWVFNSDG